MSGEGLEAEIRVSRTDTFRVELSLLVPPGRTVALLGPNGAGKSTAVAALAGLVPLDEGRIALAGTVLDEPGRGVFVLPEQRDLGVVFQDLLLFPHLTVLDNVAFGLRSRGLGREESAAVAMEWLNRFALAELAAEKPGHLSGGQAQRVALARALAPGPGLLLLDEPLSALDVTTRAEQRRALADHLSGFDGPRLVVTHDPTEAFLLGDEIVVVEDGRVTQVGSAQDIRLRPRSRFAADLAGSNLITGEAKGGSIETGSQVLHVADTAISGPVLATIRPSSVAVHLRQPEGSPRNTWMTSVDRIEHIGDRVRLLTGPPLQLAVEITEEASGRLGLSPGAGVWVSVKATEIGVEPYSPGGSGA